MKLLLNETDFHDTGHLNCFGAEKATRYIGKYLTDHYDFATNHSEAVRARWDADCKRYDEAKAAALAVKTRNRLSEVWLLDSLCSGQEPVTSVVQDEK